MIWIDKDLMIIRHHHPLHLDRWYRQASAAESAVQHLAEQRDQLRGELQGQCNAVPGEKGQKSLIFHGNPTEITIKCVIIPCKSHRNLIDVVQILINLGLKRRFHSRLPHFWIGKMITLGAFRWGLEEEHSQACVFLRVSWWVWDLSELQICTMPWEHVTEPLNRTRLCKSSFMPKKARSEWQQAVSSWGPRCRCTWRVLLKCKVVTLCWHKLLRRN